MTDISQGAVTRMRERLDDHGSRIRALELNEAGAQEWRRTTTQKLDGIISGIKWVLALILGGLIMAAVTFVISGGLHVAS